MFKYKITLKLILTKKSNTFRINVINAHLTRSNS